MTPITAEQMQRSYAVAAKSFMPNDIAVQVAIFTERRQMKPGCLYAKTQRRAVAWPRQDCWAFLSLMNWSASAIARHFGVDHTTVLYGQRQAKQRAAGRLEAA